MHGPWSSSNISDACMPWTDQPAGFCKSKRSLSLWLSHASDKSCGKASTCTGSKGLAFKYVTCYGSHCCLPWLAGADCMCLCLISETFNGRMIGMFLVFWFAGGPNRVRSYSLGGWTFLSIFTKPTLIFWIFSVVNRPFPKCGPDLISFSANVCNAVSYGISE